MAVMSMIFSTIFKRTIENYPIYYLTGTIFWQLFSGATNSAMTALVDNRTLLLKVKLPKQTFVLARIYTALTNFGYTCVAYVLMLVVFQIKISPTMFTVSNRCIFLPAVLHGNRVRALNPIRVFCGYQIPVFDRPDTLDVHVGDLLSV